ncbi:MAG: hypothetical protein SGBAC_013030 [Bacillariaceae sp.]
MPPHQAAASTKLQLDPLESMEEARTNMTKKLKQSLPGDEFTAELDIKQTIQLVRAILTVNSEIWERCKGSYEVTYFATPKAIFRRPLSTTVRAFGMNGNVQFQLHGKSAEKTFNVEELCTIPDNLAILQPEYLELLHSELKLFIDFEALLERSLLLHEDVLKSFLVALKHHLETVQVRLGEIDNWLMEDRMLKDFVNTSFSVSFDDLRPVAKGAYLLGTYKPNGLLDYTFQISELRERTRLTKLLDFVQSPAE